MPYWREGRCRANRNRAWDATSSGSSRLWSKDWPALLTPQRGPSLLLCPYRLVVFDADGLNLIGMDGEGELVPREAGIARYRLLHQVRDRDGFRARWNCRCHGCRLPCPLVNPQKESVAVLGLLERRESDVLRRHVDERVVGRPLTRVV